MSPERIRLAVGFVECAVVLVLVPVVLIRLEAPPWMIYYAGLGTATVIIWFEWRIVDD